MVKPTRNRRPPAKLESAKSESPRKSDSESDQVKDEEKKISVDAVESEPSKTKPSTSADAPPEAEIVENAAETSADDVQRMNVDEQAAAETGQEVEPTEDPLASAGEEQANDDELVLPDRDKSDEATTTTTAVHEVNIIVDDEVVSQNDDEDAVADADADADADGQGEEVIHHVEIIEEQPEDDEGVEYHIEQEEEEDETSEIILCVDTSAAGQEGEFEVIQPSMFIQKQKPKQIIVNKPPMKMASKANKPVVSSGGPRMVKLTYGGNLSVDSADDSGNIADESEAGDDLETRVIQFTTTTVDGQQYTATSVAPTSPMKMIKAQQPGAAARMYTTSGASGTISGVKRSREVLTLDNYESEPHYEVDDNGMVLVKKSGILQRKRPIDNKSTSGTPKSIACYYCEFRAPSVEDMELHLAEYHLSEGDELHRKRMRKRMIRAKEVASSGEQSSDFEGSSNELSLLDETRESRNPNFECWRCNNRSFAGSGSLRRHINAVHLRLGNHPCQYCGKLFSAKHNLKVHITTVHLRQRNYVCVFCNRTYTENRSLKRHIDSTHAGQKYEGNEYVFAAKEKLIGGRPKSKGHPQNSEYIEATEVIYETDGTMASYEIDEEQITKAEARRLAQEEAEADEDLDEDVDEVTIEEHQIGEHASESSAAYPMYIVPTEDKTKTQVVIYHDDSISASEEVVVSGGGDVPVAASEEVVITNNVDLPIDDNDGMETFEIKLEVNGNQEDFYAMEAAESGNEQQLVVYETKGAGDDLMMSGSEVVVANEEEVGEHEQVTVHYISADGITVRGPASTYHVNTSYEDDLGGDVTGSGSKRKPYQRIKCGYCGDFFCSRQLFYKHANKVHREQLIEDWHSCPECRRYFPSVEAVKLHCSLIHANENKKTECPYCPTMFTRTCTYYRHANQSHLEIISKSWLLCDGCDLYMPEADKLRQHQVHAHPPRKQKN